VEVHGQSTTYPLGTWCSTIDASVVTILLLYVEEFGFGLWVDLYFIVVSLVLESSLRCEHIASSLTSHIFDILGDAELGRFEAGDW